MGAQDYKIPFSTQKYEKRLIVFIDLIGFKNFVLSNYGNGKEEVVKKLYSFFEEKVSDGAKHIKDKGFSFKPSFNFFSDSIMISFPLELFNYPEWFENRKKKDNSENKIELNKAVLLSVIQGFISEIQLHALRFELLTRGCVTIGDIYHKGNTWFGPGIIEAYIHENEIAIYPRVILSKSALDYFNSELCNLDPPIFIQDSDRFYFLDYLSLPNPKMPKDDIEKTIHRNIEELVSKNKFKSLQKWEWFREYFNKKFYNDPNVINFEMVKDHIKIVSCGGFKIKSNRYAYFFLCRVDLMFYKPNIKIKMIFENSVSYISNVSWGIDAEKNPEKEVKKWFENNVDLNSNDYKESKSWDFFLRSDPKRNKLFVFFSQLEIKKPLIEEPIFENRV